MPGGRNKTAGATAPAAATIAADGNDAAAATESPAAKKTKKYPCGKCDDEVTTASLYCRTCEQWFHKQCCEGMTPQYFENCQRTYEECGMSAFLCKTCMKVWHKVQKQFKDLKDEIREIGNRVTVLELEKEALAQKCENMEMRTVKVKEGLEGVEREVVLGMEKAKEEVKKDIRSEAKEMEERSSNIVVYGIPEATATEAEERKEYDRKKVDEVAEKIGVALVGAVEVKFRAGRRIEGAKPRPMIVKVESDETRERLFANARRLARADGMKDVFISADLSWEQREEARKTEKALREEADRKTEEAKKEGRRGQYAVVGQRGKRRIVWRREEAAEREEEA